MNTDQNPRAFGNFWVPNKAIIFKGSYCNFFNLPPFDTSPDVCGKLEGESIVGESTQGIPNLQYRVEPSSAAPPTNSDAWKTLRDWREPIHHIVNSPDISIHIGIPQSKPLRSTWVCRIEGEDDGWQPGDLKGVSHSRYILC
jgi:hypothetical protein